MKTIIIDDEPKAIELLKSYLKHFSKFELKATFRNGLKALEFLNTNSVDVVFIDINMPHLNGLSLAKMIDSKTSIIFTTAYAEHALESYDVNAVDYLLKPISLSRFSKTVSKLIDKNSKEIIEAESLNNEVIYIKSGLETHQIKLSEINYLKKDGNYLNYILSSKKIIARQTITEALTILTGDYIQIHKSYIINPKKVSSFTTDYVVINGEKIPIGAQYKKPLISKFKLT